MPTPGKPRVFLLGNPDKPRVHDVFEEVADIIRSQADLVGKELSLNTDPIVAGKADFVVVLGGDGTLLSVARGLGPDQRLLIGVNMGKFGYLTEFTLDDFRQHIDQILFDKTLISDRTLLLVRVFSDGLSDFESPAVNDCVIHAGPPYRMIELCVRVDGKVLTTVVGDGLVICSPSGSTGHNLSAGGPIVLPGVRAIVLTPLAAHSLTHRPLVVECSATIEIIAEQAHDETSVSIDGQVSSPFRTGSRLEVRRAPYSFRLVRNPMHPDWYTLVTKLKWGTRPSSD